MGTFDVVWNRRHLEWRHRPENAPWIVECILLERTLLDGKPQMRIIGRLAAIDEDRVGEAHAQEAFWSQARRKLGKLRRLQPRDIDDIEALLAKRVPRPAPATTAPTVHPSAHPIRGPHQPLRRALRAR
ncbi:hypothetical protein Q2941_32540 [Bradyrhizobium sp. UFLA05-153]